MFKIIAVTNRRLCEGDFWERLGRIAASGVAAILLREKDLSAGDYEALAGRARDLCARGGADLIAHSFIDAARRTGCRGVQLPASVFFEKQRLCAGLTVGVSAHTAEEARRAVALGAAWIVAGHIFETESKQGLPPRGLDFLAELCARIDAPVYAIGGITERNIAAVRRAGAAGACLMSSLMRAEDVGAYVKRLLSAAR